jgi:hypothetical protein
MKYNEPWEYHIQDNFLPYDILYKLQDIPIQSDNTLCDGTRTPISGRHFFTPDRKDEFTKEIVRHLIGRTREFQHTFGYDLSHSYLRVELCQDDNNFWQVPHIDTLEKRITMIVYIDCDDTKAELGTDLYVSPEDEYHTRAPWGINRCLVFKTDETKWHGFTPREFEGKRRVLLINYVDKDNWNSVDQVWDTL